MIYPNHKVIFIHIPKNAGSTITRALDTAFERRRKLPRGPQIHDDNITKEMAKEFFIFAVQRNPWDRFVSLWNYWKNKRKIINLSFEEFCVSDFKTVLPESESKHLLQQVQLNNQPDFVNVDFWVKYESLQKDYDRVCSHLGLSYDQILPHINSSKQTRHYKSYYTPELKEIIGERFKEDIEFFGYEF